MEPQHRAPAPALHQVVALTLVYQRLAVVVAAAPAAFFVLPFVSRVFLGTLQWVTRGHAVFFLLLWLALYLAAYRLIHQLASSRIALEKTLRNNATRLPLLSGWSSFLLARYVWGPVATAMAIPETLPVLSFRAAWQTALSLALLGLSVLARYVGPKSIVRCSPFPLILNPLRLWFHHPFLHLDPKDHSQLQPDNRGRRLQSPTLAATVAQCTVALIVGIVLAHINITVLTRYTKPSLDNDPVVATAILTACIWTIAGPLVWTALDGVSHEFDPRPYQPQHHLNAQSINLMLRNLTKKLVLQSLLIPAVSIAFALVWWHPTRNTTYWFGLYTTLGLSSALVALYLGALEEALRWLLFHPPADWTALVAQLADDSSMERQLGVLLYSVLQDTDIVAEVCRPTSRPGVTNLDMEESRRQERLIRDMSIFLSSKSNRATPEVPLEEDVLRLTILESLGGSERQPLNANASSARHNANVRAWVDWKLPKNANFPDGPPEPLIVPLVRALCVYIGGLGETLISRTQRARSEPNNTWILPPGMLTCADWALRALSRCLIFSLTGPDEKPMVDWHSTHVAMLVPAAMQAIFLLRRGCQRFGHTTLVAACDDTASATIRCLTTTYRGRVDLVGLEPEPLAWVQSLVSAPSSRNSQALVVSVSHKME